MVPAIKITSRDIGKTVYVLTNGRYLKSEIVGYHTHKGDYVAYIIDSCEYKPVSLKYCENEHTISGLRNRILSILEREEGTIYPLDSIAEYLWETDYDEHEQELLACELVAMQESGEYGIEYHKESEGYYLK